MPTRGGGSFFIEFTPPRLLSVAQVRGRLLRTLQLQARDIKNDLEATTATWQKHHPQFFVQVNYGGGQARIQVWTNDVIWGYLDRGTATRYATMSKNFVPKTRQMFLGSGAGAGYKKYVSLWLPRPGIQPRHWTYAVVLKHRDSYAQAVWMATIGSVALTKP